MVEIMHTLCCENVIQSILERLSTKFLDFSDRIRNQFSNHNNWYSYGTLEEGFGNSVTRGGGGGFRINRNTFTLPSFVHLLDDVIFSII